MPKRPQIIRLPNDLGIEQAEGLRQTLLPRLEAKGPVILQASEVDRIHTAALQLFCMFCRDRRAAGRETRWQSASPALRQAAALLGMTTLLQLSQEEP